MPRLTPVRERVNTRPSRMAMPADASRAVRFMRNSCENSAARRWRSFLPRRDGTPAPPGWTFIASRASDQRQDHLQQAGEVIGVDVGADAPFHLLAAPQDRRPPRAVLRQADERLRHRHGDEDMRQHLQLLVRQAGRGEEHRQRRQQGQPGGLRRPRDQRNPAEAGFAADGRQRRGIEIAAGQGRPQRRRQRQQLQQRQRRQAGEGRQHGPGQMPGKRRAQGSQHQQQQRRQFQHQQGDGPVAALDQGGEDEDSPKQQGPGKNKPRFSRSGARRIRSRRLSLCPRSR